MIYLKLFLIFLKIGAIAFGGGYGMIAVMKDECLANNWLGEEELLNFIGVAESTPGPIAVNLATFIGSSQGGLLGGALATLGVILPALIIILIVFVAFSKLLKYRGVEAFLNGVKPAITSLIIATSIILFFNVFFNLYNWQSSIQLSYQPFIILMIIILVSWISHNLLHKKINPILLIIFSSLLGIILYW